MIVNIDKDLCSGCEKCAQICPVGAIYGEKGKPQTIDYDKCILCGQCIHACKSYASVIDNGLDFINAKMKERNIPSSVKEPIFASYNVCDVDKVTKALEDKNLFVVVQCAPAVRNSIAEEFNNPLGELTPKKLASVLKKLGFNKVYDTNFAADLTIMEEANELVKRLSECKDLPMFTSCCPAWVKYIETNYPKFSKNLSTCKSPQQMAGAIFKTYGSEIDKVDASKIFSVAIMPCTCKKYECDRQEMNSSGHKDVDVVLTTRELAYLIKNKEIDFNMLDDAEFDIPFGSYTGAGALFGVTGGVMEAAIRSAYELMTKKTLKNLELNEVRGKEGIKKTTVKIGNKSLRVGVVSGIDNVESIMKDIQNGLVEYDFIEVMACPVGCVSGGGQPKLLLDEDKELAYKNRIESTYKHDKELPIRKSHENEQIKKIYENFLVEPLSEKSHKYLHTSYCLKKEEAK